MAIRLPADLEMSIRDKVSTGRFENEADVIRAAMWLLEQREERILGIRDSFQAGIEEYERGETIELTDEVWDRLEREAAELAAKGIEPKPDVCP